jgi:phosphatidylglycerophosphate synthase
MISALVTLSLPGILSADQPDLRLPYWVSVTLVSRDLFVLVGAGVVFLLVGMFHTMPSGIGKAATVMQFILIAAMLASPDLLRAFPKATWTGLHVLWGLTVALGILSWLGYVRTGSKLLTAGGH